MKIEIPVDPVKCFICSKFLKMDHGNPMDGIICHAYGNYGSTVFDPIMGGYLIFVICDNCFRKKKEYYPVGVDEEDMPV